jgi:DNA-binding PucR family transcriptional regulator
VGYAKNLVRDVFSLLPSNVDAIAAISASCADAAEIHRGMSEAREVLAAIMRSRSIEQPIVAADELGAARLFLSVTERTQAERFAADTLGPLLNSSDPSLRGLLVTVDAFLQCSRSVQQSAAHLQVHQNTVRYRLSRIRELTGLDLLGSDEDQLSAYVALKIIWLSGMSAQS